LATLVAVPENRSALAAIERLAESERGRRAEIPNPLFLHGSAGTGKTHLVSALAERFIRRSRTKVVTLLPPNEWNALVERGRDAGEDSFHAVPTATCWSVAASPPWSATGG